jgi:hypothetical protein
MATQTSSFSVPLTCLHPRCSACVNLILTPNRSGYGLAYPTGWSFWNLGFPKSARNLGLCPNHHRFTVPGTPPVDVIARPEAHGLYYELFVSGTQLAKITFPTNTQVLQIAWEAPPMWASVARRVAKYLGF